MRWMTRSGVSATGWTRSWRASRCTMGASTLSYWRMTFPALTPSYSNTSTSSLNRTQGFAMTLNGSYSLILLPGRWLVGVTLPALLLGCLGDDSCEPAQFHCDGRVARNCAAETRSYVSVDCAAEGMTCAVGRENAFCALSSTAEPRCETSLSWCEEDEMLVYCREGYAVGRPCPFCIEANDEAFCARSDAPSPACPAESGRQTLCDVNDALLCREGFEVDRLECGGERQCVDGRCEPLE